MCIDVSEETAASIFRVQVSPEGGDRRFPCNICTCLLDCVISSHLHTPCFSHFLLVHWMLLLNHHCLKIATNVMSIRVKNVVTGKGIQVGIECKWVQWCGVNWRDLCEVILFWSEVKRSEVSYGEILGDKSTMYIRVTLYWGYLIVLWLFHLVCIFYCGCFNLFYGVWECVCVGFVMCGCFGNMCTCIYCVLYCLYCVFVLFCLCILIIICCVCTSVRTTATEWQLSCS